MSAHLAVLATLALAILFSPETLVLGLVIASDKKVPRQASFAFALPVNLWVMVVAVFVFGATNVCARLVLTPLASALTPLEHAGGVTAASEFGRTAASVGVDSLVGGAFTSGAGAYGSFGIVGGLLGVFAAAQLVVARVLTRKGPGTKPDHPPLTTSKT